MGMMTVERLHDLLDENPDKTFLQWSGNCHDCHEAITVVAVPKSDGIHINGGCVYEPATGRFFFKCNACFKKDPVLRNYQECEVYSRVVGYLRPVRQWNDAKAHEFRDRRTYDAGLG